jgi:hypothetical protein
MARRLKLMFAHYSIQLPIAGERSMQRTKPLWYCATGSAALLFCYAAAAAEVPGARQVSFELDVQPIFQSHCMKCHQPGGQGFEASGLDLRSYDSLMKGTKHGAVVVPGNTVASTLMVLIDGRADKSIRMPHNERPLLKQQVEIVRDWVKQGAVKN